jgi:hypothetical protein
MGKDATASLVLITQVTKLGHITNIASVNSTTPDNDTTNNIANNTTDVVPVCDLEITKLVNASKVNITDIVENSNVKNRKNKPDNIIEIPLLKIIRCTNLLIWVSSY